ncbi:MAG: hypothetical protein NTZ09_01260 [Candidatus Hydrogenedentes bacterium]|nr:hypothetical protein [Candidatus Hydrogenedentota bacterium]
MKKIVAVFFVVAGILAVLVGIRGATGMSRQQSILQQPPLTTQEIEQLSRAVSPVKSGTASPNTAETSSQEVTNAQVNPAPPLTQPATKVQRLQLFTSGWTNGEIQIARVASSPFGGVAVAKFLGAGVPGGDDAWLQAQCNLMLGNWKEARTCFTEILRNDFGSVWRPRAWAYLAWLEDDPEMAARYLEIACSGVDWYAVFLSVELASATGNTELAEKYMARGRSLVPDFERRITEQGRAVHAVGLRVPLQDGTVHGQNK